MRNAPKYSRETSAAARGPAGGPEAERSARVGVGGVGVPEAEQPPGGRSPEIVVRLAWNRRDDAAGDRYLCASHESQCRDNLNYPRWRNADPAVFPAWLS